MSRRAVGSVLSGRSLLLIALIGWLAASLVLQLTGHRLGLEYWLSAGVTGVLSFAALVLARQHAVVQERLANLELREKMTCFDSNRIHLRPGRAEKSPWAFNIVGDARSALFLFDRADAQVRQEFVAELRAALQDLREYLDRPASRDIREDLQERALALRTAIEASGDPELAALLPYLSWANHRGSAAVSEPEGVEGQPLVAPST